MRIELLKRWQWAIVGVALGLGVSLWRGWAGTEGALMERTTIDVTEFEQSLLARSSAGQPAIKDIQFDSQEGSTIWLTAEQLVRQGNRADSATRYIPVKVATRTPFVPPSKRSGKASVDPNFTVMDYLKSIKSDHPELHFSTRWWDREPVRSGILAVVGMLLMAGACPWLMSTLMGAGVGRQATEKAPEYDLSRFGKDKPKPNPFVPIKNPAAVAAEAPIKAIEDKSKQYHGEFYPTETHAKRKDSP